MSSSTFTIHLHGMHFFAYHGLYDEEKVKGNNFEMNVSVSFVQPEAEISHIDQTINYAAVYEIIQQEMAKPRELLETFLQQLAEVLKNAFPQITDMDMTLYKLTAPIEDLTGRVGVQLRKNYM